MAFSRGPKIVTDGLVLALDAANTKSYPGSGATWYDLSGNGNNGTLVNGPTFNSENQGSILLDGANDYINNNGAILGRISFSYNVPVNFQYAITIIYNKVLTASEVLQNYNATKGRFGL